MICDTNVKVKNLLKRLTETPNLKIIVVMDKIDGDNIEQAGRSGIKLMQFSELEVSDLIQLHVLCVSLVLLSCSLPVFVR